MDVKTWADSLTSLYLCSCLAAIVESIDDHECESFFNLYPGRWLYDTIIIDCIAISILRYIQR